MVAFRNLHPHRNGQSEQRVQLFLRCLFAVEEDVMMVIDKLHHRVPALKAVLGIESGIIVTGRLEQSHQCCRLLVGKGIGRRSEISSCCRLDAIGIAAEVNGVQIHRQDVFLREDPLELQRHNPLFGLHHQNLYARNAAEQARRILRADTEQVLCQLLGNGAGAACMTLHDILACSEKADDINAVVQIETLIFCVNKRTNQDG